jgi:hypothetical protein
MTYLSVSFPLSGSLLIGFSTDPSSLEAMVRRVSERAEVLLLRPARNFVLNQLLAGQNLHVKLVLGSFHLDITDLFEHWHGTMGIEL